jgi:peptidoglycan/xylan/chitin deacetylase (PgdA/CDA1 family)
MGVLRSRTATEAEPSRIAPREAPRAAWNPPVRWVLVAFSLFVLLAVVLFQGMATHTVGVSTEPARSRIAPLAHAAPILIAHGDALVPVERSPGRNIALTFDDGPSGQWTPVIGQLLHREGVPATFFEIGSQVARYPSIVRRLVRYGDEIGNHTFTHVLLAGIPRWERNLQISLTDAAIAGVTGRHSRLLRPPYSATPGAVTPQEERVLAQAASNRYYIVLADYDSRDWMQPGVADIVANATPPGGLGGIVMFHDGGGNRSQTASALRVLIPRLRQRRFHFVTVSELVGLPAAAVMPRVRGWVRRRGQLFVTSVRAAYVFATLSAIVLLGIAGLVILRSLLLFVFARRHVRDIRRRQSGTSAERSGFLPSTVIIVPAYDEEVDIERSVRSLATSNYPDVEVVVVDDGSSDRTPEIVASLGLPNVRLVRQDNRGKAAALQNGVQVTDADIVTMVDADTQFESGTLRTLVQPFADPRVAAVSGNTKVGNRNRLLGRWQHLEYVIGFNLDRRMYDVLRCMPTIPGAVGAFRRTVLEELDGVPGDTLAEDTDLTLAIGRLGGRVV